MCVCVSTCHCLLVVVVAEVQTGSNVAEKERESKIACVRALALVFQRLDQLLLSEVLDV